MKYFVKDASILTKVKHTRLRKLLMMGTSKGTELSKKALASIYETSVCGQYITAIDFYNPQLPQDVPTEVFSFNDQTKLTVSDFYKIFEPVSMYELWLEDEEEKERIRLVVATFENAAKFHGARQATAANGFISDVQTYLYESGKALKTARENLYKELCV